jgi:kynurenine formamidase
LLLSNTKPREPVSRGFFFSICVAAATAATLAAAGCAPRSHPAAGPLALADAEAVDLTHAFDASTIYWPTEPDFALEREHAEVTPGGWWYASNRLCTAEHGGTHMDAPLHFAAGAPSVDAVPLQRLIRPGVVVDVTAAAAADRDYQVGVADLQAWERANGRLPDGVIVLLRTGFGRFWPDRARYLGTAARGPAAVAALHFPGLSPAAAEWLVRERTIAAVGLDTASIDHGQSQTFETHRILAAAAIPAFENVAELQRLPPAGFTVIALPMKIRGGSGGPLRIVAHRGARAEGRGIGRRVALETRPWTRSRARASA